MSINPHDDYEKLAKLLYPSIEASGNVYYGQTRKLTMDEILGKNDLGFESHIETPKTINNKDDFTESKFCWRLGPLSGTIDFNKKALTFGRVYASTFFNNIIEFKQSENADDYHTYFAKYKINKVNNECDNILNSANYKTYETNLIVNLESIIATHGESPLDSYYSDANFYIDVENLYLYILILKDAPYSSSGKYYHEADRELCLVNVGNESVSITLCVKDADQSNQNEYEYSTDLTDWHSMETGAHGAPTGPHLEPGQRAWFRCTRFSGQTTNNYIYFRVDPDTSYYGIEAHGNINSLLDGINFKTVLDISDSTYNYCFYNLFRELSGLTKAPILPCTKLSNGCYAKLFENTAISDPPKLIARELNMNCYNGMFKNCKNLVSAPELPATNLAYRCYYEMFEGCISLLNAQNELPASFLQSDCYRRMFYGCTSLGTSPKIMARHIDEDSMTEMFYNCTSLSKVICLYRGTNFNSDMHDWLGNVASSGTLYVSPFTYNNQWYNDDNAKPDGWYVEPYKLYTFNVSHVEQNNGNMIKQDYVMSYGKNNANNGRGDITDVSTLNNMEKSFDENEAHQMNTYNADGSYNQEIWGYKSFCSPVQFRNGLYTEFGKISDLYNSEDSAKSVIISTQMDNDESSVVLNTSSISLNALSNENLASVILNSTNKFSESEVCSVSDCVYFLDRNKNKVVEQSVKSDQDYSKERSVAKIEYSKYQGNSRYSLTLNDSNPDEYTRYRAANVMLTHNNIFQRSVASLHVYDYNQESNNLSGSSTAGISFTGRCKSVAGQSTSVVPSKCDLTADTVKINSVPIFSFEKPYNTATFVNGGIYLIVIRGSYLLNAVTAGNILYATINASLNEWAVERGPTTNYGLNVGMIGFTSSGSSVNTNLSILNAGDYLGVRLMLLSPASGINNNYCSALAICIKEKD